MGSNRHDVEELKRTPESPAGRLATQRLLAAASDPAVQARYPNGTSFIAADSPAVSKQIADAVSEGRAVALIFPDGSEAVSRPPDARFLMFLGLAVAWLAERTAGRRRAEAPRFVPREWVTEFHAAPDSRAPAPVI